MFSWSAEEGLDPNPPGLERGEVIGGYVLGELLGSGGMGHVFRAFDPRTGRDVAIKLVRARNLELSARLQREGELIAALEHPGILRVHASGVDADWGFLVCELVEGARKLSELLDGPQELLLDYLSAAGEALGHAHARGVLHRDVKADNVLIDAEGQLKVTDFGLGWRATATRLTLSGVTLGTPYAMAPEQISTSPDKWVPATDVWGLGVLLYQILTGELPFDSPELLPLCSQIASASPRRPSSIRPRVSRSLEDFCLKALAKEPRDRPKDGAEFARGLAAARAAGAPRGASGLVFAALGGGLLIGGGALWALSQGAAGALTRPASTASIASEQASQSSPQSSPQPSASPSPSPSPSAALDYEQIARRLKDPATAPAQAGSWHLALATRPGSGRAAWEERLGHAEDAERLLGETPEVLRARGVALRRLMRRPEATAVYRLLAEKTGAAEDLETFAHAAFVQGHPAVAVEALGKIERLSPHQLQLRYLSLDDLGRQEEREEALRQLREGGAPGLAARYEQCGRRGVALNLTRRLLRDFPEDQLLRFNVAWSHLAAGRSVEARELLLRARPQSAYEREEVGDLLVAIEQIEGALRGECEVDPRYAAGVSAVQGRRAWRAALTLALSPRALAPELSEALRAEARAGQEGLTIVREQDPANWTYRDEAVRALLAAPGSTERWEGLKAAATERSLPVLIRLLGREAISSTDPERWAFTLALIGKIDSDDYQSWAIEARLRLRRGERDRALERAERCLPQARWMLEACQAVQEVFQQLGRSEEARRWGATLRNLTRPERARSLERFQALPGLPSAERERALGELLFQDPLFAPARLKLLEQDFARALQGPAKVDLRSALVFLGETLRHDPRALPGVLRLTRAYFPRLTGARLWEASRSHREELPQAMVLLAAAEQPELRLSPEFLSEGLGLFDGWVEDGAGEPVIWLLRGWVAAAVGELYVAERDLAWAARVTGPSPLLSYRRALVAGALKRDSSQVLDLLERARGEGFGAWKDAQTRAEFASLRDHPRFRALVEGR